MLLHQIKIYSVADNLLFSKHRGSEIVKKKLQHGLVF